MSLRPRSQAVLSFLRQHHNEHHYSASIREIVLACGLSSTSVARHHVVLLRDKGYLTFVHKLARSIVLTEGG